MIHVDKNAAVPVSRDVLERLREDVALLAFLFDNWSATYCGEPLYRWINDNGLRLGGRGAALIEAYNVYIKDVAARKVTHV